MKISVLVWVLSMFLMLSVGCSDSNSSRETGNNGGTDDTSNIPVNEGDSNQNPGTGTSTEDPVTDTSGLGYYFQAGDWGGYAWTSSGLTAGGTVTELTSDWTSGSASLCISGTLIEDYSSLGMLGMGVSQSKGSQSQDNWSPGSTYSGVYLDISKNISTTIRMELTTADGAYCAEVPAGGVVLSWSDFATECWGSSGEVYNGQPFVSIQLYAPGDENSVITYDYCLNELYPYSGEIDTSEDVNPTDANWESEQTVCDNGIGRQGGFTYEYWKDAGTGCMELGPGGAFSIEWTSGTNNILARKGLRPGSLNQVITYAADYRPNGNSYLTLYGWTTDPLVEYYVVDSWGSWRPPGGTRVGTVNSDGGTYDLYRTQRVQEPSIQGTATFYQYWSVRTEKQTSGTITFANHVAAWQNQGWQMGDLYEVSMCVEGYQSTGYGNVYQLTMTTN